MGYKMLYHHSLRFKLDVVLLVIVALDISLARFAWQAGFEWPFVAGVVGALYGFWSVRRSLSYILFCFCAWYLKRTVTRAYNELSEHEQNKGGSIDV